MKAWSIAGLLFAGALLATVPISPQVTPRGLELSVDHAQAITYGRYRRVQRRAYRRGYSVYPGYSGYSYPGYAGYSGYSYPGYTGYSGYSYRYPGYSGYSYRYPGYSGYSYGYPGYGYPGATFQYRY